MELQFELGYENDIDELEQLYNDVNDYLAQGVNYPGWKKGIYPARQNAIDGVSNGNLYVARHNGRIAGSVILSHEPEPAYQGVKWQVDCGYEQILVIYTFVVHPDYMQHGVGKVLMDFCSGLGTRTNMKAIRLDVVDKNLPAIKLYEKCGFQYIDTVDLGLGCYGLDWFGLYEKVL